MDSTTASSWMLLSWYSTLFVSVLGSFFLIVNCYRRKHKGKLPPGPPGWPIVGNLFHLGKRPHESLFHLAMKYGPLMTLRLGMKNTVVVSSPAVAKEIFKNNDDIFAGRTVTQAVRCASYWKSSLVFNAYGQRWRMLRRLCSVELLNAKRLNALQHLRRDQVFEAIRLIYEENFLKDKTVNIGHTAFLISLNLVGNMIFSRNVFGWDSDGAEDFKKTVSKTMELIGAPNLADFFPFLQILDPQGISRNMTVYLKRVFALLDNLIDDRISSSSSTQNRSYAVNHGDFLDALLGYIRDDGNESSKFTRADITPLLYTLFLAASETTGTTVEWAMAELIRNPHVMKRAQAELENVVGRHRKVEEADFQRLPYLNAVVKEALRLHPTLPLLIPHRAESSCEIAGFLVSKHSQVIVNVWGMGRDPSIWNERASEFDPERFMSTNKEMDYKGNNFELIPFGAGRRICAGLSMGSLMVHFVLASFLHSFDWSISDGQNSDQNDMAERFGFTLQKSTPLIAIPTPRLPTILYRNRTHVPP